MNLFSRLISLCFASVLAVFPLLGYYHHERRSSFNVQHYCFEIDLNDTTFPVSIKSQLKGLFPTVVPYGGTSSTSSRLETQKGGNKTHHPSAPGTTNFDFPPELRLEPDDGTFMDLSLHIKKAY